MDRTGVRGAFLAGLVMVLVLAACGHSSSEDRATVAAGAATQGTGQANPPPGLSKGPPAAADPAADACGLVTAEEAADTLGDSGSPEARPPVCEYQGRSGRLIVTLNRVLAAERFELLRQDFFQRDAPGVGDRAFLSNGAIFVLKGSSFFQIAVVGNGRSPGASDNALIGLARAAANRV